MMMDAMEALELDVTKPGYHEPSLNETWNPEMWARIDEAIRKNRERLARTLGHYAPVFHAEWLRWMAERP
jgi:hypothetical protein